MKNNYIHTSDYFFGNRISEYGLKNGDVDYRTLSQSFDSVLNNEVIAATVDFGWEIVNGADDDRDYEIYQYYIISDSGASILQELTDEIVYYNETLDMYVWGITHFGTSWDYVLTSIPVKIDAEDNA